MARQDQLMRRRRMNYLFARLGEKGITDRAVRHTWASGVLKCSVPSFTSLTVDEIEALIAASYEPDVGDEYVICGELGPDDLPCVHDASHLERGWPCVDQFGREWVSL